MPLDAHQQHDGDHEGVLELDQEGQDRAQRGQLRPAARQPVEGHQDSQRADRVDLPPHRRVEDRARVEHVHRGGQEAHVLSAPGPELAVQEASRIEEQHGGDATVGQDARDLDQAEGDVHPDECLERSADGAQHPQDVEVAGRIIGEVVG
jgi:hypothetical protein